MPVIVPPAPVPEYETAPPIKRANPDGIPVRLYDGTLVAFVSYDLAEKLKTAEAAETFRRGSRRYLRLHRGITVPRTPRGWDVIELVRKWHGDERTAEYVAHKDRQSERLKYSPAPAFPRRKHGAEPDA